MPKQFLFHQVRKSGIQLQGLANFLQSNSKDFILLEIVFFIFFNDFLGNSIIDSLDDNLKIITRIIGIKNCLIFTQVDSSIDGL